MTRLKKKKIRLWTHLQGRNARATLDEHQVVRARPAHVQTEGSKGRALDRLQTESINESVLKCCLGP